MLVSRRDLIRQCVAATFATSIEASTVTPSEAPVSGEHELELVQDWLFGGRLTSSATLQPDYSDASFSRITLPHCVVPLSWQDWDPSAWQDIWVYRRHFDLPPSFVDRRIFLEFEHVMCAATPVLNGQELMRHPGGFLPFCYELTGVLRARHNLLAVAVDSRWSNVPPEGSPKGPASIDYLLPGGIAGAVRLRALPHAFIASVFAKPANVLRPDRDLEVVCEIDALRTPPGRVRIEAQLEDGGRVLSTVSEDVSIPSGTRSQTILHLHDLENIELWNFSAPKLYDVVVTLSANGQSFHSRRCRTGFRDARFKLDGFYLNGRREQLFGLNRHEIYPYFGRAVPARVARKDAEILKHELNCNAVRCSHYPQSEAFLNACDELGLLVWEEIPGWQYIGDPAWQNLAIEDVKQMVRRDRNHPSIIVWGVRINESHNDPDLYRRTKEAAKSLDDSRPTSGSMVYDSTKDWLQDVFAYDDYHSAPDGSVGLIPPIRGVPFFFSEAVGQFSYGGRGFNNKYRRAAPVDMQQKQAIYHAQVHDRAAGDVRYAGVTAWCAFEYPSLMGAYHSVKYPGVADMFRIPKLGASIYRAQVDPRKHFVIEANFYWDFGPETPSGPGRDAVIFSNLDQLEIWIGGERRSTINPDRKKYPHLRYPPFFADLTADGSSKPELRIVGYLRGSPVFSRSFSSDPSADRFILNTDDPEIVADGSDATRMWFGIVDKYGSPRLFAGGEVRFSVDEPAVIIGDNPFNLTSSGGMGAIWIKSKPGIRDTTAHLYAEHTTHGTGVLEIKLRKSEPVA